MSDPGVTLAELEASNRFLVQQVFKPIANEYRISIPAPGATAGVRSHADNALTDASSATIASRRLSMAGSGRAIAQSTPNARSTLPGRPTKPASPDST